MTTLGDLLPTPDHPPPPSDVEVPKQKCVCCGSTCRRGFTASGVCVSCDFDGREAPLSSEDRLPAKKFGRNCRLLHWSPTSKIRPQYSEWHVDLNLPRNIDKIDATTRTSIRHCTLGKSPWPLVLIGGPGTGKTCAALVMLDVYGGCYFELRDLNNLLNRARSGELFYGGENGRQVCEGDIWDSWKRCTVSVLDEIGLRSPTEAQYETLKRAVDVREGNASVIASNAPLDLLKTVYDDRIVSRLASGTVVAMPSQDRRAIA